MDTDKHGSNAKTMKTQIKLAAFVLALSTLNSQLSTCFAQGSLTPPGAPAPTMKSLTQVEPRTPISSAPFAITNPGSYYLTTNINVSTGNAITIASNGVTLDLNGFTISSTEATPTGTGILLAGAVTDIIIRNGHIKGQVAYSAGNYVGSGFANGIFYSGSPPLNVRIAGVTVSGCLDDGIHLGTINSTVVDSCTVLTVGGYGIVASSVLRSIAKGCGNDAISADTAADSSGNCGGGGYGLDASFSANNCTGFSVSGTGLNAASADNCYGASLIGDGIDADAVSGSEGDNLAGGGASGIYATTALNCSGTASDSGSGVDAITAHGCSGSSGGFGEGVFASLAEGCYGTSVSGTGVLSETDAQNCYGASTNGMGISAITAQNCMGVSGGGSSAGIYCENALNCSGSNSSSGQGIVVKYAAFNCQGYSSTGTGLVAFIANSCIGQTTSGTAFLATHNINTFSYP